MRYIFKEKMVIINTMVICLLFFMFCFFIGKVNNSPYIGIRASNSDGRWKIERIFNNGLAANKNISLGSEIVKLDDKPAYRNKIMNKWLIVEQVNKIEINEKGVSRTITFEGKSNNSYYMMSIFLLLIVFSILIFKISKNGIYSLKTMLYYCFCVVLFILLILVVPSSIGIGYARILLIFAVSAIPIILINLLFIFIGINKIPKVKLINKILLGILIINTILAIINYLYDIDYIFSEYLSLGPIYYVVLFSILISVIISVYCWRNKIVEKNVYKNIIYLIITGVLPLLIFYILPIKYNTSYLVLIIFIGNIVIAFFNLLVLSRSIRINFNVSNKICYILFSIYLTIVTISLISFNKEIPFIYIGIVAFFEYYYILMMLVRVIILTNYKKNSISDVELFIAEEKERENISTFIHDNIIQDIIYISLRLQERKEVISKDEVIEILDDVIYSLRELCTEIYPIMISEIGLEKTIKHFINDFMKKHNVKVNMIVNSFSEKNLSTEEKNFILRSIKELINNSIKHGKAKIIYVILHEKIDEFVFIVKDDGIYLNNEQPDVNHFGLGKIKEKVRLLNGKLLISIDNGTEIKIVLPR